MSSASTSPDEKERTLATDSPDNLSLVEDQHSGSQVDVHGSAVPADEHEDNHAVGDEEEKSDPESEGAETYEDDGDEHSDEDEDDEDDEEPVLKYERLGGDVHDKLLKKDSASALTYSNQLLALGTHAGIVHVLDLAGEVVKSVKPHSASIIDICMDETADFIGTASIDGQVVIYSLSTPEVYSFDKKRPMRTLALEPQFAKRSTRAFVCGAAPVKTLTAFLVLAYTPPDTSFFNGNEVASSHAEQARKAAERPELRIINRAGEELSTDALSISGETSQEEDNDVHAVEIGQKYIEHLVSEGDFVKAARLCPKVCGQDVKRWEDWIFIFVQQHHLQAIIPYIPTETLTLGHLVYEMILAYFLSHDRQALLKTIKDWPNNIYDIPAVIVAVQAELERSPSSSANNTTTPDSVLLMECLAELYTANRQPGKALPYFLRLRRPNVLDLIRDNNLFTAVQDQALLLVEFDHELIEKRRKSGEQVDPGQSAAITLLVDHIHSIPIGRVVQQLQSRPYYLYLYLDALFAKDPHLTSDFADAQVELYAEYAPRRLIDFLRASSYYSLEKAYNVCKERDQVPEMVFLLGRMGNNKQALNLIIERLGDVNRAIDFAKDQGDEELWEDLLRYSETRPAFIRGLLENVGADINPIRLIRRIKNGLEIPGLKGALIKILHDFNLQTSLLEGCQTILNGDCSELAQTLHKDQTAGFLLNGMIFYYYCGYCLAIVANADMAYYAGRATCPICSLPLMETSQSLLLLFLCRHVVHAHCTGKTNLLSHSDVGARSGISGKIAFID
ncbi:hypothetical protein EW026_g4314 [Hermanssonia centrifuga]|uniref:Vps41 beta-propeller domain-containing protein n=1 Tax=Hermanssonia centrifuga TaxID=98765 RepID=A0A4S4KIN0_9APHY|nr:hypothetical protein EW026_g4314 [Hermanssonia centrifuga]